MKRKQELGIYEEFDSVKRKSGSNIYMYMERRLGELYSRLLYL
jgi:hypothetical protein